MALYKASEAIRKAQKYAGKHGLTDGIHWCYRCHSCSRLITKLEVLESRAAGKANLCPCGSKVVQPTNAKVWEELFLVRCWKLIYAIHTKSVAAAPTPLSPEDQKEADRLRRESARAYEKQIATLVRKSL
jgi:DNA-directed RNA polymerase subunit RPC12/RpoP